MVVISVLQFSPCRPATLFRGETYRTITSCEAISLANRKIKLILYKFLCQFIIVFFFFYRAPKLNIHFRKFLCYCSLNHLYLLLA